MTFLSRLLALLTLVVLASCGGGSGGSGGSGGNVVNTNLALLNISVGSFTPGFNSGTLSYSATVGFTNEEITITATPAANNSSVKINGTPIDSFSSVTLPLVVGENLFVIAVTSSGSSKEYRLTITRQDKFDVQAYFKTSNAEAQDNFGKSVAVSGNVMVFGAPKEDSDGSSETDNSSLDSGAAFVFLQNGNSWSQQAYLKASNVGDDDSFGESVAISGDTIVVSAPKEDSDGTSQADNSSDESGAVYIFTRNGNSWIQEAYLKASNSEAGDQFGSSVALDGDTLVVGAISEDSDGSTGADNSVSNSGAVYVFTRTGTTWTQQSYLKASNADADDNFGSNVSVSSDSLIVAAPGEDSDGSSEEDDSASESGAAYIFTRTGNTWTQQAYLKASNAESDDIFGSGVSIDADSVVIGASGESSDASSEADNSLGDAGAAYVFTRTGSAWTQQGYLKASNVDAGDGFGASVAIELDIVFVGSPNEAGNAFTEADNSAVGSGAGYVFTRTGGVWSQQYYIKSFNTDAGDNFGSVVDLANGLLAAGAINEDSDRLNNSESNAAESSGAGYIFQ